ncbi:18119_t:CDS:2, partial [Funneliformis geosporum]
MAKIKGKENPNFKENCQKIKDKLISKEDTILIFDEAHFTDPNYHQYQKDAVRLGYKVILMSATFKGAKGKPIPFSITTSYPRRVVRQSEIKISDADLAQAKVLIFLKKANLTSKQKSLLENPDYPIAYCVFDKTALNASTGITKGMPAGSVFIGNASMEMAYDDPQEQGLTLASIVQQIGRVARLNTRSGIKALAIILNNFKREKEDGEDETEEIDMNKLKDASSKFVEATLTGDTSKIVQNYAKFNNANFLRAALALPYKSGLRPEEVMCGL